MTLGTCSKSIQATKVHYILASRELLSAIPSGQRLIIPWAMGQAVRIRLPTQSRNFSLNGRFNSRICVDTIHSVADS